MMTSIASSVKRSEWFVLLVLLLIGFGLRMYGIERYGLWIDEVATATCLDYTLPDILECRWAVIQSPLSHVATDLLYTALGRPPLPIPDWLVRFPEVLAGMGAIIVAWFLTRELLGARAAWLNALLWTFSASAIAYSQEARSYAWLMLFSNLSAWLLLRGLRTGSLWRMLAFGVVAALNYYSHYLGAFVTAGEVLFAFAYLLLEKKRGAPLFTRTLWYLCAGIALSGLLIVPWLRVTYGALNTLNTSNKFTEVQLNIGNALDAQTWLVFNSVGLPLVGLGLSALALAGAVWMWKRARTALLLCVCWLAVTIVFLLVRGSSFTAFRYWLVIQVPFYLLVTAGALAVVEQIAGFTRARQLQVEPRVVLAAVGALVILALVPALPRFYTDPFESFRFDDWRGAAAFLQANAQPNDFVLAFGDTSVHHVMGLHYYLPRDTPLRIMEPDTMDGDFAAHARTQAGRAWGIIYTTNPDEMKTLQARIANQAQAWTWNWRNLEIVSLPPTANETLSENAQRLVDLVRPLDAERFEIVDALLQNVNSGDNLVANPQFDAKKSGVPRAWQVSSPGGKTVTVDGASTLHLDTTSNTTEWVQQQIQLQPAQLYVMRFACRNTLRDGTQHIYLTFPLVTGKLLVIPNGGGYACPSGAEWHTSEFVFRAPTPNVAAPRATLLLRSNGDGASYWRGLSLAPINGQ